MAIKQKELVDNRMNYLKVTYVQRLVLDCCIGVRRSSNCNQERSHVPKQESIEDSFYKKHMVVSFLHKNLR